MIFRNVEQSLTANRREKRIFNCVWRQNLIRSAIEMIFKFSACANWQSLGNLAIEPSSSTISHKTATGSNPASIARSTRLLCVQLFLEHHPPCTWVGKYGLGDWNLQVLNLWRQELLWLLPYHELRHLLMCHVLHPRN